MKSGVLNLYKDAGFTSHDAVAKLRGLLGTRKIGHTGTLDPDATGVLPILVGNAAKACDLIPEETKDEIACAKLNRSLVVLIKSAHVSAVYVNVNVACAHVEFLKSKEELTVGHSLKGEDHIHCIDGVKTGHKLVLGTVNGLVVALVATAYLTVRNGEVNIGCTRVHTNGK